MNIFITGSVGSGKTTFKNFLIKHLNQDFFESIDLDVLGKKIIAEHNIEIPADKNALFNDQLHLFHIEKKVWSHMSLPETNKVRIIEASTFFECPILFQKDDIIICVESDKAAEQVLSRDKEDRAALINKNQISRKTKHLCADYIVKNNRTLDFLENKAKIFAENLNYQQTSAFKEDILFVKNEWHKNFPELSKKFIQNIVKNYSRIDRFYHNLKHLIHLFTNFNHHIRENIPLRLWKRAMALAIFYHDIKMKFEVGASNEEDSVEFMFNEFRNEGILHDCLIGTRSYVTLAADIILATKTHTIDEYISSSENGKKYTELFLDLDLLILSDKENFDDFEKGIRKEWYDFDDENYGHGRKKVLINFLDRPNIFKSELFQNKNDEARKLIVKAIVDLGV